MEGELQCPQCGSRYFVIAARFNLNAQQVANTNSLACVNCHGVFDILDNKLKEKDPRK